MLTVFWIFRDFQRFGAFFKGANSGDVRQKVVRRGWHHFNMQSVIFVAGLLIFNSLDMPDVVTYLGLGFIAFGALIYLNTQRNIKFSEKL